eukprot:199798-Pyramimonas_sp.AAC.1
MIAGLCLGAALRVVAACLGGAPLTGAPSALSHTRLRSISQRASHARSLSMHSWSARSPTSLVRMMCRLKVCIWRAPRRAVGRCVAIDSVATLGK